MPECCLAYHTLSGQVNMKILAHYQSLSVCLLCTRYPSLLLVPLQVTPEELLSTASDPVTPFSAHVIPHMNKDHADSLTAMVKHFTGLTVDHTLLVGLDRLGMDCVCIKNKGRLKCRLPYVR